MTIYQDKHLDVLDYRFTVPKDLLSEMQQALDLAAQAGQSPHPYKPEQDLQGSVLAAWGFSLFANRDDRALTDLHIPSHTTLRTLDTFLSLIAPFLAMNKPAYFSVVVKAEDGDREFFYHFEERQVIKKERITMNIPVELEISLPRGANLEGK